MFVVDTNVLLYAANREAPEHEICLGRLAAWRARPTPWYTTWGILYEFLRVVTHPRVFERPWRAADAWQFVASLLASPGLRLLGETERHAELAAEVFQLVPGMAGNLVFDARTATLMREHGVKQIYTRDADFHRFPFVEVLDPLAQ